jgi:hypothetical protein
MTQVVECLPSKLKAQIQSPVLPKGNKTGIVKIEIKVKEHQRMRANTGR